MTAEELSEADAEDVLSLWHEVGLTRPWNDPGTDFRRALAGATSTVLGARSEGRLLGAVMVGHDGHRGWVYYLAVSPDQQRGGLGTGLMGASEAWLRQRGVVKIQLMVRRGNDARAFYDRIGYEESDVTVHAKWLEN